MEREYENLLLLEQDKNDHDTIFQTCSEAPPFFADLKTSCPSFPKKSKRAVEKKVVSVPIKDVDGTRLKGENAPPPSDSWSWRKYGQKPIKGSPYPRGYYRCSSSKGCPARKQVERNRVDPTMLVITYSSEHNHPWPPPPRTQHHKSSSVKTEIVRDEAIKPTRENEEKRTGLSDESLIIRDEFIWFDGIETSSTILESPVFMEEMSGPERGDRNLIFPMEEEDESLFADLGELPECSAVFRYHRGRRPQVQIY